MCRLTPSPHGQKTTHHTQECGARDSPREMAALEFGGRTQPKRTAAQNRHTRPHSAEFTRWPRPKYATCSVALRCSHDTPDLSGLGSRRLHRPFPFAYHRHGPTRQVSAVVETNRQGEEGDQAMPFPSFVDTRSGERLTPHNPQAREWSAISPNHYTRTNAKGEPNEHRRHVQNRPRNDGSEKR